MEKVFIVDRKAAFSTLEKAEAYIQRKAGADMIIKKLPQTQEAFAVYEVREPDGTPAFDSKGGFEAYLVDIHEVDAA